MLAFQYNMIWLKLPNSDTILVTFFSKAPNKQLQNQSFVMVNSSYNLCKTLLSPLYPNNSFEFAGILDIITHKP